MNSSANSGSRILDLAPDLGKQPAPNVWCVRFEILSRYTLLYKQTVSKFEENILLASNDPSTRHRETMHRETKKRSSEVS
jgi:hypothetical protein